MRADLPRSCRAGSLLFSEMILDTGNRVSTNSAPPETSGATRLTVLPHINQVLSELPTLSDTTAEPDTSGHTGLTAPPTPTAAAARFYTRLAENATPNPPAPSKNGEENTRFRGDTSPSQWRVDRETRWNDIALQSSIRGAQPALLELERHRDSWGQTEKDTALQAPQDIGERTQQPDPTAQRGEQRPSPGTSRIEECLELLPPFRVSGSDPRHGDISARRRKMNYNRGSSTNQRRKNP